MEISAERETILVLGEIRDALKNMTDEVAGLNFRLIPSNEDRRERIATACLAGLLTSPEEGAREEYARWAIGYADALIAELDREGKC